MLEATKTHRNIQEIQSDYAQLCTKAGDLQYKIACFEKDLDLVNGTLRDLNFEAVASSKAAEDAAAATPAPATEEVSVNG